MTDLINALKTFRRKEEIDVKMKKLNVYLNFNGNTEDVFNFYKSAFKGKFIIIQRFKDMPDGNNFPKKDQNKIMHVSLQINKDIILMASDALESQGQKVVQGNNFYIQIEPESKKETDKLYESLSTGGKIEMKLQDAFWGAYSCMFKDKFGTGWMINYTYPKKK